jgi:hypothetical protein
MKDDSELLAALPRERRRDREAGISPAQALPHHSSSNPILRRMFQ